MNWAQRYARWWMAEFRAGRDRAGERARIARAVHDDAKARLRDAGRPARPWLHVTASPRIARFLEATGAQRGRSR